MKPMISDAQGPLLRAVQRLLVAALAYDATIAVAVVVEAAVSNDWASATFIGQQHWFELRLEPDFAESVNAVDMSSRRDGGGRPIADTGTNAALTAAVARLSAAIGDVEIEMAGSFVADIAVVGTCLLDGGAVRLTLEALTLLED